MLMVLGIDQLGEVEDSGSYNNRGLADVVSLLIFDETNKNVRILQLNRDTMLNVRVWASAANTPVICMGSWP